MSEAGTGDLLMDVGPLVRGTVINRPSKVVKTGYVADVQLEDGREIQVRKREKHDPVAGC